MGKIPKASKHSSTQGCQGIWSQMDPNCPPRDSRKVQPHAVHKAVGIRPSPKLSKSGQNGSPHFTGEKIEGLRFEVGSTLQTRQAGLIGCCGLAL